MIWFWMRGDEKMQVETRFDNNTSEFVIVTRHPDGHEDFERFPDLVSFRKRLHSLERKYETDKWAQSRGPEIVPDGFPKRPLK